MTCLVLKGQAYALRPTFAALLRLEERSQTGLITLARRFAEGTFTLKEALAVFQAGLEGAGTAMPDQAGELLVQAGLAEVAGPLAQFLHEALSGETDNAGKA